MRQFRRLRAHGYSCLHVRAGSRIMGRTASTDHDGSLMRYLPGDQDRAATSVAAACVNTVDLQTHTNTGHGSKRYRTPYLVQRRQRPRCSRPWISGKGLARRLSKRRNRTSTRCWPGSRLLTYGQSPRSAQDKNSSSLLRLPSGQQQRSTIKSRTHEDVGGFQGLFPL